MKRLAPGRFRLAFRLRTIIVAITALCLLLGSIARRWAVINAEFDAATTLQAPKWSDWHEPRRGPPRSAAGWVVSYPNPEMTDGMHNLSLALNQPVSAAEVLAFWRSPPKIHVRVERQRVTDQDVKLCNSFRNLSSLALTNVGLTDRQLALLSETSQLATLILPLNPLHDASAERISKLPSLKYLDLSQTEVTDIGVCHLARLRRLESLLLNNTSVEFFESNASAVSDRGVRCLAGCHTLQHVELNHTRITGQAMADLAKLPALLHLSLRGTDITDEGVRHLLRAKPCPPIAYLCLSDTNVTDEVIPLLKQLPGLVTIELDGTRVDPDRAAELGKFLMQRAFPP